MANLAQIAGLYTFLLFGADGAAASTFWVTFVGVIWIVVMTRDLLHRHRALRADAVVPARGGDHHARDLRGRRADQGLHDESAGLGASVAGSWLNPFDDRLDERARRRRPRRDLHLLGLGQPRLRERGDRGRRPARRASRRSSATVILVAIYVVVSIAAQAFHGPQFLVDNSDDVLSASARTCSARRWDKLLIIAVLTSASASTQTTILPDPRTTLSMAAHGAIPEVLRPDPPALPDAGHRRRSGWAWSRSSGTSA